MGLLDVLRIYETVNQDRIQLLSSCSLRTLFNTRLNNGPQKLVIEPRRRSFQQVLWLLSGNCPNWSEYCQENSQYYPYMKENCKKTCKLCDNQCKDTITGCKIYETFCNQTSFFYSFMKENCKRTCKVCI